MVYLNYDASVGRFNQISQLFDNPYKARNF